MRPRDVQNTDMMHSRHRHVIALAVVILAAVTPSCVSAWSNGGYSADVDNPDYGTHDWIADKALTLQTEDVSYLTTTYHDEYLIGTEAPDNPDYIGDSVNHHVYYHSSGALQDDVGAVRASSMYDLALEDLESGDFSAAAYHIGAMAHYIADMGVFGHTMGSDTDWGAEVHHSDYEGEFETILDSLALTPGMTLEDTDAYNAALALARAITFGEGDIRTNVWMDDNYDWSDAVFRDSAMASLYDAVSAVAAVINHLMAEAASEPPPDDEPDATAPTAPGSLEAYLEDGLVTLVWASPASDGGSAIIEYRIFRKTGSDEVELVETVSSLTLTWTDDNAEAGTTYVYWVAAFNSVGLSALSGSATVTIPVEEDSLLLPAIVSGVIAALVSGGALVWRRQSRGDRR